ncbi:MAG: hypothetical protein HOH43_06265 [Candidatus Latescibacteria bacterium]|nr:hypothetical protein [Candidatus Latescibacterota bacterium]
MNLPMRNTPPDHGIRVPIEELEKLVGALFVAAGMPAADASLMGRILSRTDARCVYSHGTRQAAGYIKEIIEGRVNPTPEISVVNQTTTTAVLDGDGGMGYLPCHRGAEMAVAMALEHGVGVSTTRNHFHFGAAGTYSRLAMVNNCIGLAVSSHRYEMDPDNNILGASGGSPMSFAVPAGSQPPLALDMSSHVIPSGAQEELFDRFSAAFTKSLGLGAAFQVLGGILPGIWKPEFQPPTSQWTSNQGAFIAAFNVASFQSLDTFKSDMDDYIAKARAMRPLPGMTSAELPGGMEWQWEQDSMTSGIPIDDDHREVLETIASDLGVATPFRAYDSTRF